MQRTKSLNLAAKPNKQTGEYPEDPEDVEAARPLCRCTFTRRISTGYMAVQVTAANAGFYAENFQYGLLPAGMEAALQRCLLLSDVHRDDDTFVHAGLDFKNAHTSIGLKG
eukprot:438812-Prymnesium_polylepis.1